jgi:hypothetical protein
LDSRGAARLFCRARGRTYLRAPNMLIFRNLFMERAMSQVRLFVAVVTALIAGSASSLAVTCPPGYRPITQGTISNDQTINPTLNTSSSTTTTPNTISGTSLTGTSGGSGAPQNCEPIPTDSNKNRNVGTTPTGKTTTQTQPNKNRGVPVTPTGK